jgi:signal transduction histidine kinase
VTGPAGVGAADEPAYLAGPPLFWRLLLANLLVVLGGAVVGTLLTRQFVVTGAFTPLTHALMVLAAIALSAGLTAVILRMAFAPLRALRQEIERSGGPHPGLRPAGENGPHPALRGRPQAGDPALPVGEGRGGAADGSGVNGRSSRAGTRRTWLGDPDIMAVSEAVHGLWDRLDQHVRLLEETNRRLEAQRAELAEKTVQLRRLATQVLAAQEEERRRIARELHDDTMQSLAALIMGLERGLAAMPPDVPHLAASHQTVARLRDLAVRILDDLRHLALDLRPAVLDDYGLVEALGWLAQTQTERTGLRVTFEMQGEGVAAVRGALRAAAAGPVRLAQPVENALYRIVQEALSNAARHARATRAAVRLRLSGETVVVEVEDDGCGIDPVRAAEPGHMGLFNMRERAALLGGRCEIGAGPAGRGTLVRVAVPATPATSATPATPAAAGAAGAPAQERKALVAV